MGCSGFLTRYRRRDARTGLLDGDPVAVDFAANAESLGARAIRACTPAAVHAALETARSADRTTAIVIPVDIEQRVGGYESWWDVPIAEVSTIDAVQKARDEYVRARQGGAALPVNYHFPVPVLPVRPCENENRPCPRNSR